MRIFALADPHLSLATPGKSQDKFGPQWVDHAGTIEKHWRQSVRDDDLVLVAGDISWAMHLENAQADLGFLGSLPGEKVLIRGNHDYWWSSLTRVRRALGPRMHALQNDAVRIGSVAICGTRLWDVPGVSFSDVIDWRPIASGEPPAEVDPDRRAFEAAESEKIFRREMERLRLALTAMDKIAPPGSDDVSLRIVMMHYPPCDARLNSTEVTDLLEKHVVDHVVFGHVHNLRRDGLTPTFGLKGRTHYHMTACDYLGFSPLLIASVV